MTGLAGWAPTREWAPVAERRRGLDVVLLLLAALTPFLAAAGVPSRLAFGLAVVLSGWVPGRTVVALLGLGRSPVRAALAVGSSLLTTVGVGLLQATVRPLGVPGHPRAAWDVAVVVPALVLVLLGDRAQPRPEPWETGRHEAHAPDRPGRSLADAARDPGVWCVLLFTAVWGLGLRRTDASELGPYGLLPAYSPLYWAGFVALALWVAHRAVRGRPSPDVGFRLALVCLVFALHLPGVVLNSAPRFTWLYKHLGVVDYIGVHGVVNDNVDVYHNWPGFFAYVSWLNRLTGADSLTYAAWTPVAVNLAVVFLASALYRQLGVRGGVRRLALVLLLVGNWIGEDYFSPQGLEYVMFVGFVLCCVAGFGGGDLRRWRQLPGVHGPAADTGLPVVARPVRHPSAFLALMALGCWVMVATHQITPLFLFAVLGSAAVLGVWRTWPITVIGGLVLVSYTLIHLPYVRDKYHVSVNLNPFENAGGTTADLVTVTSAGAALAGKVSLIVVGSTLLLGGAGLVLGLRRGLSVLSQTLLTVAPAAVLLVQSYGGEALYRVVMFSQVGLAPLAALALVTVARRGRSRPGTMLVVLVVTAAAVAFQPAHYVNERALRVTAAEVRASQWLSALPSGAIVYYAADAFPARIDARYVQHVPGQGQYDPVLTTIVPALQNGTLPGPGILDQVQEVLEYTTPRHACSYVVFSPSQLAQVQTYGPASPAQYERLKTALTSSARYRPVYDDGGVLVLRNTRPGRAAPASVPGAVTTPQACDR